MEEIGLLWVQNWDGKLKVENAFASSILYDDGGLGAIDAMKHWVVALGNVRREVGIEFLEICLVVKVSFFVDTLGRASVNVEQQGVQDNVPMALLASAFVPLGNLYSAWTH